MKFLAVIIACLVTLNFSIALDLSDIDYNYDNKIDINDLKLQKDDLGKTVGYDFRFDIDENKKVDLTDLVHTMKNLGKPVPDHVLVGVRRFGGYPNGPDIRNAQEELLSFPQWDHTWPYYAILRDNGYVDIHPNNQEVANQEIQLAAASGLDYFAFDTHIPNGIDYPYDYPLKRYLASPYKTLMRFALIVQSDELSDPGWKTNYMKKIAGYMADPQYLKNKEQYPVLFMWRFDNLVDELGENGAKTRTNAFIDALNQDIGIKPIIVMMDLGSKNTLPSARLFGADARTSYLGGYSANAKGLPYSDLRTSNKDQWNSFASSDLDYIPLITIGLDPRPKMIDPLLYDFGKDPPWYQQGTPKEISQHLSDGITWVKEHKPVTSNTNMVLMAAWDDPSESGWLTPTLKEGNQRLNAMSLVLEGKLHGVPISPYAKNIPPAHPIGDIELDPFPIDSNGDILFNAGHVINISGKAPMAARLNMKIQGNGQKSELFFINGKGTYSTRKFSVSMPPLPAGENYYFVVTGDVKFQKVFNITIK